MDVFALTIDVGYRTAEVPVNLLTPSNTVHVLSVII